MSDQGTALGSSRSGTATPFAGIFLKTRYFLQMIDIWHSLFALPFAYLGAFLAARGFPTVHQLGWITLAMVSARTAALGLNRLIDRHIDSKNPRTANWILPRGLVRLPVVVVSIIISFLVMLFAAAQLNDLCFKLAPLAVIVLTGYSYTKRFTWTANVILGLAIGLGPVGAWLAITARLETVTVLLGLSVALWIAGFDTMYACQDEEFDRREGLHSIPSRFGTALALDIAAWFHTMTVLLLLAVGFKMGIRWPYFLGVLIAALVLRFEHRLVSPNDLSRMHTAAFRINRYVGAIILIFALLSFY